MRIPRKKTTLSEMANKTNLIQAVEKGDVTRVQCLLDSDNKITKEEYNKALEIAGRYVMVINSPFRTKAQWAELRKNRATIKNILLNYQVS
ncbi:MAG: hypothetical protein J6N45_09485 [Alphaproteobacteria bacterium]|nr:hypothetical protein [Alphaproteobacteria bacterium]